METGSGASTSILVKAGILARLGNGNLFEEEAFALATVALQISQLWAVMETALVPKGLDGGILSVGVGV